MRKLLLILVLFASQAYGELIRQPYPGVRPTGMGNAFLAISDDNNAMWYNPAGLARVKGVHLSLIDTSLAVDSEDTFNRLNNAIFNGDYNNLIRPDRQFFRFNFRPTLLMQYFSFSIFSHATSFTKLSNLSNLNAKIDLYSFNDIGAAVGFAVPMGPYFSAGVTGRFFNRTGVDAYITGAQLLSSLGLPLAQPSQDQILGAAYQQLSRMVGVGFGLAIDVGVMGTVPLPKGYPKVTFAAVMDDVGKTTFRGYNGIAAPARVDESLHLGSAVQYDFGKKGQINLAFDYRNLLQGYGGILRNACMGVEYRHPYFSVRGGLSQGYPTAGLSVEFPPSTRIHLSTFAVELGQNLWENQYRVFMFQFAIGFNPS
jgi:hypothetical protein